MRRFFLLIPTAAATLSIALTGCGGDGESPLDNALGYLPEDTPFAVALDTDLEGEQFDKAEQLVERFPFGQRAVESLREELEEEDVDFERDLEPLLGNPFVVGSPDARSFVSDEDTVFIGAIETKDGDKLQQVVDDQDAREIGEKEGAKLYEDTDDDDVFAVKDEVLIVADSRETLEAALEQRSSDDRMGEDSFNEALEDLPDEALVRAYSNIQRLLEADPSAREAREVKWVGALRTLGVTAAVESDELALDFNLKTDDSDLSDEDLPLPSGSASPEVAEQPGLISVGVRDPVHTYDFALRTARAVDSEGTGEFETAITTIEQRLEVDVEDDLFEQLSGDVSVNVDVDGNFAARGQVRDPDAVRTTLRRIARGLPRIARQGGDILGTARRGDFFALADPDGTTVVFGVVGDTLVVSNDGRLAGRVARLPTEPVSGAEGSVVVTGDTAEIAQQALRRLGLQGAIGGSILTRPLGEMSGSVETDTSGVRGSLTQKVD